MGGWLPVFVQYGRDFYKNEVWLSTLLIAYENNNVIGIERRFYRRIDRRFWISIHFEFFLLLKYKNQARWFQPCFSHIYICIVFIVKRYAHGAELSLNGYKGLSLNCWKEEFMFTKKEKRLIGERYFLLRDISAFYGRKSYFCYSGYWAGVSHSI